MSVDVIAHYAYDVASPKPPEPKAAATETKPIDTKPIDTKPQLTTDAEKKIWGIGINSLLAFVFGVVFVLIMLAIAVFDRNPPPNSIFIYRVVLALAAAGVGAVLPGVINVDVSSVVRAGGAAAFFVVVYMVKPAELVAKTKEDDPKNDKPKQGG